MRHRVFELGLRDLQDRLDQGNHRWRHCAWRDVLKYDDIDWLAERVETMDRCPEFAWVHLLSLAYHRSEGKTDALRQKRRAGRLVREHAPQVFEKFMAGRRAFAEEQRQSKQRQAREQEARERFGIQSIVEDILGREELALQQKLWQLAWICFVEPSFRPSNVDGEWSELKNDLQQGTLDVCLCGLKDGRRTEIPDGSAFGRSVIYEASAFVALLKYREPGEWLTADLIEKWLPSVFRALGNEESWACRKCARVSAPAVQSAALRWLDRDLRQENPSAYAGADIPAELWDSSFADEIVRRIQNPECPIEPRAGLLRRLAERRPQQALPVAKQWVSTCSWPDEKQRPLLLAALDVLLALAAEEGWPIVRRLYESHGLQVILSLDSICDPHVEGRKLSEWPSEALADLSIILYKEFPPKDNRHEAGAYHPSRSDELRWARNDVLNMLASRGGAARDALQRVADAVPAVQTLLDYRQARRAASATRHKF